MMIIRKNDIIYIINMKYTHTIIILPGFTMDSTDMKYYKDN